MTRETERPWWRDRADQIELEVGAGYMDAARCYTQMRQLLDATRRAALEAKQDSAWVRVIDEAMVCAHIGVADAADDYATAKDKLNKLICWEVDVAKYFDREAKQADHLTVQTDVAAEVQMPEPVAYLCPRRSEAVMPDSFLRDASFDALYTEQQVRQLLATQALQPLTQDQIRHMSQQHDAEDLCGWSYRIGVQDAEKAHGIKIS